MRAFVLLLLIASVSLGSARQDSNLRQWLEYKRQHGKVYADKAEDALRFSLFLATKDQIEAHNANSSHSYKLGLNHLSDWTPEESAPSKDNRRTPTLNRPHSEAFLRSILDSPARIPDELDWREVPNRVTPVRNQGRCLTSALLAAAGVLEGQQVARNFTQQLVPVSIQQMLDCGLGQTCWNGLLDGALQSVIDFGGIMAERDYKYVAPADSWCHFQPSKSVMSIKGYADATKDVDAEQLKKVVATYGPVASTVNVIYAIRNYKSGVLDVGTCESTDYVNLLIVGYGTDPKLGDFWIVKLPWGSDWGENGYMKIRRGKNVCMIESYTTLATFD